LRRNFCDVDTHASATVAITATPIDLRTPRTTQVADDDV
jgi:hypothetical protein